MGRIREKNTSFFLKLENSRQTANTIYKIKNKDGEIVHDNRDILNVTENYYDTLYNSTKPTTKNIKDYLNKIDIPKLNAEEMKWNESSFRPPLCTYRLNWARRTSWGWWDEWDDTVLQTQDSKFEPWRSEAEHATSWSRRPPTIHTDFHTWMGKKHFCFFQTAETGNRTPNTGVKGSGANHYPRAPALNAEEQIICEGKITTDECDQLIKELKLNKSPGLDGLPGEFYKTLWPYFGKYLEEVFNECFDNDELSHFQKQSVITLIFKKGNKEELKNYRPISLSNIDFKILEFTLANRLQNVIGKIISPDQTAYIQNRFIGQNIRLVSDVIEFSNEKNLDGVLLSLDYEKAFDTAEHKFLFECLQLYNFGADFIKWIKTLYKKSEIYIKKNGYILQEALNKAAQYPQCYLY